MFYIGWIRIKINKKLIFRITIVLLLSWCLVIFFFSQSSGSTSSSQSRWLLNLIRSLNLERFIPEIIKGANLGTNLRKLAHMTEYCILEILNYLVLYQILRGKLIRIIRILCSSLGSIAASFIYACLDEYHQTFVPGRGGAFSDVLIDMRGASVGLLIATVFVVVLYVYRFIKYQNKHLLLEK